MDILIEEFQENIWAVALDKGRIEGLEVDPINEDVRYGSIYWAKVKRIDASLDAAFLDLDGETSGILYCKDVIKRDADGNFIKGGAQSIGKYLSPGEMIAVQAKSAYLISPDEFHESKEDKIPQMSMDITIAGRYLMYCPLMPENRISQRVRSEPLRKQMTAMLEHIKGDGGVILRYAAADLQTDIITREYRLLHEIWEQIQKFFEGQDASLIALGPDSIQRILSDNAMNSIERIEVVTMDHFSQIEDWCTLFAPDLVTKITPVELNDASQDLALFDHRDMLGQIEALFHEYAILPHGSNIIIQQTAALTAIDINKSSDKRSNLQVNLDAGKEIMRQIRLRNLGGIILIDFINMSKKAQKDILKAMDQYRLNDPCTVQIHGFTKLGLLEITRKRRTPALYDRFDGIEF